MDAPLFRGNPWSGYGSPYAGPYRNPGFVRHCADLARRYEEAADMFAALRTHFDEQAILELTALVAFQNLSSKFNAALAIPPGGLCARPPEVSDRSQP